MDTAMSRPIATDLDASVGRVSIIWNVICVDRIFAVLNECLDASLNECDSIALCEDTPTSYTCKCPTGTIDRSPNSVRA